MVCNFTPRQRAGHKLSSHPCIAKSRGASPNMAECHHRNPCLEILIHKSLHILCLLSKKSRHPKLSKIPQLEEITIAFQVALKIDYYFVMLTVAISSFSWCCCAWPVTTEVLWPHSSVWITCSRAGTPSTPCCPRSFNWDGRDLICISSDIKGCL